MKEEYINVIDRYFHGQLSEEELKVFEQQRREISEFNDLVQEMEILTEAVKRNALQKKRQYLQNLEKSLTPVPIRQPNLPIRRSLFQKLAMAAGFLLLLFVGTYYFDHIANSPRQISQQYFKPYLTLDAERGQNSDAANLSIMEKAYLYYGAEQWDNASEQFELLLHENYDPAHAFFLANAYLANKQYSKAIPLLEKLHTENSEFSLRAQWYLSLAYLQSGNIEKAKTLLQEINNNQSAPSYKERAAKILEQL